MRIGIPRETRDSETRVAATPETVKKYVAAGHEVLVEQSAGLAANFTDQAYEQAGVQADLTAFIDDTASAFAQADLVICRAGASTVTELAAIGAAAAFVPFPHAVDDHQSHNARYLVDAGAGWLLPQRELTPQALADWIQSLDRGQLLERAQAAKRLEKTEATACMVRACEELLS